MPKAISENEMLTSIIISAGSSPGGGDAAGANMRIGARNARGALLMKILRAEWHKQRNRLTVGINSAYRP